MLPRWIIREVAISGWIARWPRGKEVHSPKIRIKRFDLDLVSLSQIAERLDVTREAVRLWASGKRRDGFPTPFTSAGQSLLWAWSEVFDWLSPEET